MCEKDNARKSKVLGIKRWPRNDRPREKLLRDGPAALSDSELLAIVLVTGTRGASALDLGRRIVQRFGSLRELCAPDIARWQEIAGVGSAKIAQVQAAIEIGRRALAQAAQSSVPVIKSSADAARVLSARLEGLKKESFIMICLNSRNAVIDVVDIVRGTVGQAAPVLREIFETALRYFSAAVICAHNHPSGNICPSLEDKAFTRELFKAGEVLQIPVLDHLIIGAGGYYSFADSKGD